KAIERAKKDEVDAVLMDIKLKGDMDGIEAAKRIKKLNIPVIYLTAYADDELLERAKETEPFGYIVKPFEKQDLKIELKMALYKNKMERKLEKSRERYRTLFDNTGIPMILMDDDKKITLVNDEFERLFDAGGTEVKEDIQLTEILDDDEREKLDRYLYLLEIEDQETPKHMKLNLTLGKESRTAFITMKSLPDTDEKIVTLLEVSKYEAMMEELKKVEELFRIGFDCEEELKFPSDLSSFFGQDYFEHVKETCLNELLLLLIALREEGSGSQLLSDINTLFGTSLNPSMMYPRLRKMKEDGLLEMREKRKTKQYRLKNRAECMERVREKIEDLFKVNIVLKFFMDRVK
ncbi:MAG: response regulator, partial [Candidatus Thermoplasmatota archaeon]